MYSFEMSMATVQETGKNVMSLVNVNISMQPLYNKYLQEDFLSQVYFVLPQNQCRSFVQSFGFILYIRSFFMEKDQFSNYLIKHIVNLSTTPEKRHILQKYTTNIIFQNDHKNTLS